MIEQESIDTTLPITDNVVIETYDTQSIEGWDDYSHNQKVYRLQSLSCDERITAHNTLTDDYLDVLIEQLSPDPQHDDTLVTATHTAIGDGGEDDIDRSSSELTNEVFRREIDDSTTNDRELATATLIEAGEAVGEHITEVGLVDEGEELLINHTTIEDDGEILQPKENEYAALIKVDIRMRDISEVA